MTLLLKSLLILFSGLIWQGIYNDKMIAFKQGVLNKFEIAINVVFY